MITITGTNDAPEVSGELSTTSGAITEDAAASVGGALVAGDVDNDAVLSWTGDAVGTYGSFEITPTGVWTYTLNPGSDEVLAGDERVTEQFVATVTDEFGASDTVTVFITVSGENDQPVITSSVDQLLGEVTEDGEITEVSGTLTAEDVDGDALVWTTNATAAFGVFDITSEGVWTYTLTNAAVQDLAEGETQQEFLDVSVSDGFGIPVVETVVITITGNNDGPSVSVDPSNGFFEAIDASSQTLADSGTVTFDDPDADDLIDINFVADGDPVWSDGQLSPSVRAALLGGLSLSAVGQAVPGVATWNFSVSDLDLDFLGEGEEISWSYMVIGADQGGAQASQTLSFNITGENDAPEPEDANVDVNKDGSFAGVLSASDLDANDVLTFAAVGSGPANGSLNLNSDGSFVYTPDAGYLGLDGFEYSVTDLSGEVRTANVVIAVQSGVGTGGGQTVSLDILPSGTIITETSEVTTGGVNLIIVLDGTGSISSADFQLQLNSTAAALQNLATNFQAAANVVLVSLVLYAEDIGGTGINAVDIGTFDLVNSDFPGPGEEAANPDLISALTTISYPNAANQSDVTAALTVAESILDTRDAQPDADLADETNVIYFLTNGVQTGGNQWTNDVDRITNPGIKGYEVDIQAFGLGGSVNLGTLQQLDPDAVILEGPEELQTAFDATPLFGATLVDLSVSLVVDGTDLGEIADETSPAFIDDGLTTELSLAELEGFAGLLGTENLVSALAGFDLDGDASTVELQLFASKVFAKSETGEIIFGNSESELLLGSDSTDLIEGAGGNDVILGYDGNDTLDGGAGSDVILAGEGNDLLIVSDALTLGDDLDGGGGRDVLALEAIGDINAMLADLTLNDIEALDLTNANTDALELTYADVLSISDNQDPDLAGLLGVDGDQTMTIYGDDVDTVLLDGSGVYEINQSGTAQDSDGVQLTLYQFADSGGNALATLGVQSDVAVDTANVPVA